MEVLCPCSEEELSNMVKFLYTGAMIYEKKVDFPDIMENLIKIFGFPENLMIDTKEEVKQEILEDSGNKEQFQHFSDTLEIQDFFSVPVKVELKESIADDK